MMAPHSPISSLAGPRDFVVDIGKAAKLLGLQPGEVMMCAAHTQDLDSARKLGLRTAYIHRPHERPGREVPMPTKDAYDIVTTGIDGIATALGS